MAEAVAVANRARTFWPEEADTWGGRCRLGGVRYVSGRGCSKQGAHVLA